MAVSNWEPFDITDIVEKRKLPKRIVNRFYEINPLGEIRFLDRINKKPVWKTVKPVSLNGIRYFMAPIGLSMGNVMVMRIPLDDLVKRFFKP